MPKRWNPTPATRIGRAIHMSRHPASGVLLVSLLCLSTLSLPAMPPDDSLAVGWWDYAKRRVESVWTGKRLGVGVNIGERREFGYVHLKVEGDRASVLSLEDVSGDQLTETINALRGAMLVNVGYVYGVHRHGLWAPWYEKWYVTLSFQDSLRRTSVDVPWAKEPAQRAAGAFVSVLRPEIGRAIAKGGDAGIRVMWWRIAWDLGTLLCLGLLVHMVVTHRQFLGQRRWLRGECPRCRYSALSVPEKDGRRTCPECGISVPSL